MSTSTSESEIARYRFGVVVTHRDPDHLELKWLPATSSMSDDDWMAGLLILAAEAEASDSSSILIDATEFGHEFTDRAVSMAWRDEHVIPRYNRAGVQRFAFLMPEGYPGPTAESGADPVIDGDAARFPTQWFRTRDNALAWLSS